MRPEQPSKTTAIKRFLTAMTHPDLAELYSKDMEVQVHVGADGGTRIDGEYKGRTWRAFEDAAGNRWKNIRIPLNAKTEPEDNDGPMNWDLAEHAEGIGMTGWDWKARRSRWVGFDFDAISGHSEQHAKKLTDKELLEVKDKAWNIPWVTVRKSTSGKGLHLYVFVDDVPTANHDEHAALARAILGTMSALVGFDFHGKADAMGHIMWTWHRKMRGTDGLTLLKQGEILRDIPPNWRDHVDVIRGKRKKNRPQFVNQEIAPLVGGEDEAERTFEELCGQITKVPLDQEHERLIDWFRENNAFWSWDPDRHMMVTHTIHLLEAHEALGFKGPFKTISEGKDRGNDQNCFAYPMRRGAWQIRRFGPGVAEASTWDQDSSGWTRCFYNREPDLKTVARSQGANEHKSGGFIFQHAEQAQSAVLQLGSNLDLPTWAGSRPTKLRERKEDGKIVAEIPRDPSDNGGEMVPKGWYHEGKSWYKVLNAQMGTPTAAETGNYDDMVRHVVTNTSEDYGWVLKRDSEWGVEPLAHVRIALKSFGLSSKDSETVLGGSVSKPWVLVNLPFQSEYPGDRKWNRGAAQLRFYQTVETDKLSYPHWLKILNHIGSGLDVAVKQHPWARANGILTGADYLKIWIASLFQAPQEPLPYLFLYSTEQNTGKSIFHEALSLLVTSGVVRADAALTSQSSFNGELENAVLCVVEETDLRRHKQAYNRIKDWVTSRQLPIHKKQQTPYTVPNTSHWVQCSNDPHACPVTFGDSRITMVHVPVLDPIDLIPKREMLARLEKEASDFLAAVMTLEIPPSGDRLNVPVIATDEKLAAEKHSQTLLEMFITENVHLVHGRMIRISEFFDRFQNWLDPSAIHDWSKIRVGREMPVKFPKGRNRKDGQFNYGNMSWTPRDPSESILPKYVVVDDTLTLETEVSKK